MFDVALATTVVIPSIRQEPFDSASFSSSIMGKSSKSRVLFDIARARASLSLLACLCVGLLSFLVSTKLISNHLAVHLSTKWSQTAGSRFSKYCADILRLKCAESEGVRSGMASFVDLSPKPRNRIYALVLLNTNAAPIGTYADTRHLLDLEPFHEAKLRSRKSSNIVSSILATDRQIHEEATPMLYGGNSFNLGGVAHKFLTTNGASAKFVRTISSAWIPGHELGPSLKLLMPESRLQHLLLGPHWVPADLVEILLDWTFETTQQRTGTKLPLPVDMLHFAQSTSVHSWRRPVRDAAKHGRLVKSMLLHAMAERKAQRTQVVDRSRMNWQLSRRWRIHLNSFAQGSFRKELVGRRRQLDARSRSWTDARYRSRPQLAIIVEICSWNTKMWPGDHNFLSSCSRRLPVSGRHAHAESVLLCRTSIIVVLELWEAVGFRLAVQLSHGGSGARDPRWHGCVRC